MTVYVLFLQIQFPTRKGSGMSVKKNGGDSNIAKRRKEQVLVAAVECFKLQGFHKTSMSQISAAAGMSSGHIYHYFGSKEAIVEAIVA